jgi:hypothetical protein
MSQAVCSGANTDARRQLSPRQRRKAADAGDMMSRTMAESVQVIE